MQLPSSQQQSQIHYFRSANKALRSQLEGLSGRIDELLAERVDKLKVGGRNGNKGSLSGNNTENRQPSQKDTSLLMLQLDTLRKRLALSQRDQLHYRKLAESNQSEKLDSGQKQLTEKRKVKESIRKEIKALRLARKKGGMAVGEASRMVGGQSGVGAIGESGGVGSNGRLNRPNGSNEAQSPSITILNASSRISSLSHSDPLAQLSHQNLADRIIRLSEELVSLKRVEGRLTDEIEGMEANERKKEEQLRSLSSHIAQGSGSRQGNGRHGEGPNATYGDSYELPSSNYNAQSLSMPIKPILQSSSTAQEEWQSLKRQYLSLKESQQRKQQTLLSENGQLREKLRAMEAEIGRKKQQQQNVMSYAVSLNSRSNGAVNRAGMKSLQESPSANRRREKSSNERYATLDTDRRPRKRARNGSMIE